MFSFDLKRSDMDPAEVGVSNTSDLLRKTVALPSIIDSFLPYLVFMGKLVVFLSQYFF